MLSLPEQVIFFMPGAGSPQFADSWIGTLSSGAMGALIGAAAAVVSAVVVSRRSYKDQRRIAAEGRGRRAAVDFLSKLRGITSVESDQEAELFRNELDAAGTLWVIEEEGSQADARVLTRAILKVFSEAWLLDAAGFESLLVRTSPSIDASRLYQSAHTAVLELLEGRGADAIHHFLASNGMNPDGSEFLE